MIVIDEDLLALFRERRCEWCLRGSPADPHHISARGMDSGKRLDVKWNLVSLCRRCHGLAHAGIIGATALRVLAATREGTSPERATWIVCRLQRTPGKVVRTRTKPVVKRGEF